MKVKETRDKKVNVVTLGCAKNIVDSENLITQLEGNDYAVEHDGNDQSEIVIINTCGFIDVAKQESIDTILAFADLKTKGNIEKLYVTGCLSQRYKDQLEEEIPEVDKYFGTLELPSLLNSLNADYKKDLVGERTITTPDHYAYLKISEGCNRTCSFCAIPLIRGKHQSKSIDFLVKEATHLAARGVKELMLIAQELTYYGLDIYKTRELPKLLNVLADIDGIEWIRLHYAYPSKFPMEIIDAMADRKEVCNYLDMPLQHAHNDILQSMRRQITLEETEDLIKKIKDKIPDIALRTTFLVGYPGETEEHFEKLMRFVERTKFDRVGVFQYSHEENTIAHDLEDDVPSDVKASRASRLMELQRGISLSINQEKIGTVRRVLFDRVEGDYFVGRTESDSPEVDNEVFVSKSDYIRLGDFADIEITDATEYDLYGKLKGA